MVFVFTVKVDTALLRCVHCYETDDLEGLCLCPAVNMCTCKLCLVKVMAPIQRKEHLTMPQKVKIKRIQTNFQQHRNKTG